MDVEHVPLRAAHAMAIISGTDAERIGNCYCHCLLLLLARLPLSCPRLLYIVRVKRDARCLDRQLPLDVLRCVYVCMSTLVL